MKVGGLHDHSHDEGGGTIDHPRAYEVMAAVGLGGRRREVFTRLATLSGARRGNAVLDVGCGTGYLSRILSPVLGPEGRMTGVDPSPSMVEYARRRAYGNCSYLVGEGQALDLPDASFDVVVSSLAVHHMPAAARGTALREMFRVLRPGGRLLIAEFRPPTGRLAVLVANLLAGPAMRHNPRELLGDLIPGAGFHLRDEGELPPLLYYVRAVRPE
ncbi:class I SAM-dependent methyltransferase [Sphaerisporangium sp. TRM90804]|uniref:class I SAM-dependent methyltransferase n=1 Tax=Sphaerisporangium sp. TRM90804 TaxID=3031113 RepID=UPI002447ECF8|nr:class I SAM-dependent methyltransferase [Sphaerisporangium sp. TRM90804]MDH2425419.1 class I SAM-dependent methyltransferase [Sphaerisporangium sp. TRM90804]